MCHSYLLCLFLNGLEKKSISRNIYYELANKHEIPIFDGYIYIEREEYAKNKNITIKDCFKDCFHLKPNIAYYIGEKLAEIMKKRI